MHAIAEQKTQSLAAADGSSAFDWLSPTSLAEAEKVGNMLAGSGLVPNAYQGKPLDVVVAMAMGAELGFRPMQSLQNIAVVNGKPSVFGDAFRALIMSSPDLGGIEESYDAETQTATCTITRLLPSGAEATFVGSFSFTEAQTAGLTNRDPWKKYTKRMLQWRALGFAGRDAYPDRLRGIWIEAEASDLPVEREINASPKVKPAAGKVQTQSEALANVIESEAETVGGELHPETVKLLDAIAAQNDVDELTGLSGTVSKAIKDYQLPTMDCDTLKSAYKDRRSQLQSARGAV